MAIFEEVVVVWRENEHRIPPGRVLGAIAVVEDEISMGRLAEANKTSDYPLAKIAKAYGALLRYAGAKATDDEVYAALFDKTQDTFRGNVIDRVHTLLLMMVPPVALREQAPPKKDAAPPTPEVVPSSPATGSSSAPDG